MAKKSALKQLSPQHQVFVKEYFGNGFNATKAYIAAKYSPTAAAVSAWHLLRKPKIQAAIDEQLAALGVTDGGLQCEVAEIALSADIADVTHFLDGTMTMEQLREAGVDTRLVKSASHSSGVNGQSQRVEMYDRLSALDKLIKVRGMITDKSEVKHTGDMGVRVMFDDGTPAEVAARAAAHAEERWQKAKKE